ncbi:hypothetical protein [Sphingomonas oryzagri]
MDYRQTLVDAIVMELKAQLGADCVWQEGTHVQVEGFVKMSRVAEAAIGNAFVDDDDALVKTVLEMFPAEKGREHERNGEATDLLWNLRGVMLKRLDPLP